MESTREVFWNIGRGSILPVYLLGLAATIVCARGFYRRILVCVRRKPLDRCDRLPLRTGLMLGETLTQRKVVRDSFPGLLHALFFWSFGTLFLGTLLIMAQADFSEPFFHLRFLRGGFYRFYSLVLDIAGGIAIITLAGLLARRCISKPAGPETHRCDYLGPLLLLTTLISGFCVEGLRMAATEIGADPGLARFSPIGLGIGNLFIGLSPARLTATHKAFWWLHLFLATGFIALLPFGKLRHIFAIPAACFFADLRPKGSLATIDLDDDSITQFGAATAADLTWKDILDGDACTGCGRCRDRCPAWIAGKTLSPMEVVQRIGAAAFAGGAMKLADAVGEDSLWACTTCRGCQEVCPAGVEHVGKIIEIRRNLVLMEGALPGDEVRSAFGHLEVNANPFGFACAERGEWADSAGILPMAAGGDADILYFAGCYASFDKRNQRVARSFMKICAAAGIKTGILGKKENCCGEPARKLGNEYLYRTLAAGNIENIRASGAKKVVTTCPHCCSTLGRDYRELGLDIPVEHYTTFIHDLVRDGRLPLEPAAFACTYHDSCYLGRYMEIYRAPRQILRLAGGRLAEMAAFGPDSFCCGAGGGRILAEEEAESRINVLRTRMARATGAPLLVASCPFCLTMFEDGVRQDDLEGELAVKDLAEIVAERIIMKDEG